MSLHQFIMESAYDKWDEQSRSEFLEQLTEYERIAVMFGNFNYQVENGGLMQWDDNGYSDDLDSLYDFVDNSDFDKKDKLINILEGFTYINDSINELNKYDDWYDEDKQSRLNSLDMYDSQYYEISKDWLEYLEEYLIENITDDYIQKINEYKLSSVNI